MREQFRQCPLFSLLFMQAYGAGFVLGGIPAATPATSQEGSARGGFRDLDAAQRLFEHGLFKDGRAQFGARKEEHFSAVQGAKSQALGQLLPEPEIVHAFIKKAV